MPYPIERKSAVSEQIVATNSATTSPRIPYGANGGAIIIVTSVTGATTITWRVAVSPDAESFPLLDGTTAVTTTIAANNAYVLPDALFAAPYIVAVTNGTSATFRICVKG